MRRQLRFMAVVPLLTLGLTACDEGPADPPSAADCYATGSTDFYEPGPFDWSLEKTGDYDLYVPVEQDGCSAAHLIGFAMGTGAPTSSYTAFYEAFAARGFMVVVDPANLLNLGGGPLERALTSAMNDPVFGSRTLKNGVIGHSQGGAAVANVALQGDVEVDALVGLMPALFQGAGRIQAAGLYIGGTEDGFGFATDPVIAYEKTDGPAFIADAIGVGHGVGQQQDTLIAMSTAWFRCHLAEDDGACGLFRNSSKDSCAFTGEWAKCEGRNL